MLTGKRKCLAKKVKLADLEHNSGITRLNQEPTEKNHKRLYKYMLARTLLTRSDNLVVEDGVVKRRVAPKLIVKEDGTKGMYLGISLVQAKAIGLTTKDLWRMAENGESILVDADKSTIDDATLEERLASFAASMADGGLRMMLYINFYFENITYDDDCYGGRFRSPDDDVICDFIYNRNTGDCAISNSNKLSADILPLPIWWLDSKLRNNGHLISVARGLWAVVPAEYREIGAPEPIIYIDSLMNYYSCDYCIGWLSSAAMQGARQQAVINVR